MGDTQMDGQISPAQRIVRRRVLARAAQHHMKKYSLLDVPGFGLPSDFQLSNDQRFAQSIRDWRQTRPITDHELQIVGVVSLVTDIQDWQSEIFNDSILFPSLIPI